MRAEKDREKEKRRKERETRLREMRKSVKIFEYSRMMGRVAKA